MPGEARSWGEAMDNLAKVLRAGRAGVPRDLERLGLTLVSELRLDLSKPGTGRLYTTYFYQRDGKLYAWPPRAVPHRASKPNSPPAVDEGVLRASYGHRVERTPAGADLVIASGDEKAPWLEFGTQRMAPRPHLRPLMARNRGRIRDTVADGIARRERLMAERLRKGA
jgi:hypothetical protein